MPAGGAARFLINHVDHIQHVDNIQHVDHIQHIQHVNHVHCQHFNHVQRQHVDHVQHVDHIQHVNHVQRQHLNHAQHQLVDHVQHVKHGQHFKHVHHIEEDALPTGEKDDDNQIIPFLNFSLIFSLCILRVSSRTLRELRMFKLFHYIFMRVLKSESGVYCGFMKYVLKTVRAIKSGGAARFLSNWVVLGKKWVRLFVWWDGSGEWLPKFFYDWVNVLKVLSTYPSSQAHHASQNHRW
jgi:hypothetical protein